MLCFVRRGPYPLWTNHNPPRHQPELLHNCLHMLGAHMQAEIREQPKALAKNAEAYMLAAEAALGAQKFDLVLLAARGSSDHAALYARYLIEIHLGVPVVLAAPSVFTRYHAKVRYPRCLAIGISQSGAAP